MATTSKPGKNKLNTYKLQFWYAPDQRIRTKRAEDAAKRIAAWVDRGAGAGEQPDEQALFAALHTCAFHAREGTSGRRVSRNRRAQWARRWFLIRDYIVRRNFPLIYSMVGQFRSADLDRDDLLSEGMYGLVQAAGRFNPWRGFRFSTYACHVIRRSMIRGSKQASSYRRRFPVQHDASLEWPCEEPESGPDLYVERLQRALDRNLGELTDMESRILARRFPPDNRRRSTLQEIGDAVGLSKERVRQLQNSALSKLREVLESDPLLQ